MYLIYGDSFQLITAEIKKITKNATHCITMDLAVQSLEDVVMEANYVSLFPEQKYIIVKNANFFATAKETEKELEILLDLIENYSGNAVLIFVTYEKIDLRKKVTKMFKAKYKIIDVANLSYDDIYQKSREYIKKEKYTITKENLEYIINSCQNNYDLIYNELNKLFLYYNEPQEIKKEDIKEIVSVSIEENNFKFIEAVINKNRTLSLHILNDLYAKKTDPIALIMLLAREYRNIYTVYTLTSAGYPKYEISKMLGLLDWQIDKYLKKSANFSSDELVNALKYLADIDFKIKSGQMDKYVALKTFLMAIY